MTLFIDYGHGGGDPGATYNGTTERDEIRKQVVGPAAFLSRVTGAVIVPEFADHPAKSRDGQTSMLHERMQWVNRIATKHCRLVSFHMNASTNPDAHGVEVLHYKGGYQGMLAAHLSDMLAYYLGIRDRGPKVDTSYARRSGLAICRGVPYGFVAECGFISNEEDLKAWRERGNYAVAAALSRWMT